MLSLPGYKFEREVGRGGMATVYLATQESLARSVAVKVLAPHLARDAAFVQRFVREGRIAAGLRHRHIVPIFDVGVFDGCAFMALAWMPTGSLGNRPLPLDPHQAARMLREIASALGHAHRAGVVHRDVKPENILLDDDDAHVLTDFGIAHLANNSQALTAEGMTVGTPAYMAPEQWRAGEIDGRADLYSLGIVFYQCLTGRVPFIGADGWSVGMQHMQAPLPMLPATHAGWQPILDRLLAKLPEQRFPDATSLMRALDDLMPFAHSDQPAATAQLSMKAEPAAALFRTGSEAIATPIWRRPWVFVVSLLALLASAWFATTRDNGLRALLADDPALATILVLPCENFANVVEHRELGDTLAEVLAHRLSRVRDLTVIARSTARALSKSTSDPQLLGASSGASHVLSCSIRRAPEGVRIGTELVETERGTVRWSADFERSSEDLLEIVDELALGISERLVDQLAGPDRARLLRNRARSLEALALVEQAQSSLRQNTLEAVSSARADISRALLIDPDYAAALVTLAESFVVEAQLLGHDSAWWRQQVAPLLKQALALDADSAPAYALRSRVACAQFDWIGCRADLERALSLAPGAEDIQALAAQFYRVFGPHSRGVEFARRWVRTAPDSAPAWTALTTAVINTGRTAAGLDAATTGTQRFPEFWPLWQTRAQALQLLGRCKESVSVLDRAPQTASDSEHELALASALACAGDLDRLAHLQRRLENALASGDPVSGMRIAVSALAGGNRPGALDALEAMYHSRDPLLAPLITQPQHGIEQLAGEPRLVALLDLLQLPDGALRWPARETR